MMPEFARRTGVVSRPAPGTLPSFGITVVRNRQRTLRYSLLQVVAHLRRRRRDIYVPDWLTTPESGHHLVHSATGRLTMSSLSGSDALWRSVMSSRSRCTTTSVSCRPSLRAVSGIYLRRQVGVDQHAANRVRLVTRYFASMECVPADVEISTLLNVHEAPMLVPCTTTLAPTSGSPLCLSVTFP